ncbi:MAG: STAS domain-containing protein [Candidatus Omnitrophota bacterium]
MSGLKITKETPDKNLTVIRVHGEFENTSVLDAKEALLGTLREAKGSDVMIDFSEIEYIDSSGISVLLDMAKIASERKLRFGVVSANEHVKKILLMTKVDKVLKIY